MTPEEVEWIKEMLPERAHAHRPHSDLGRLIGLIDDFGLAVDEEIEKADDGFGDKSYSITISFNAYEPVMVFDNHGRFIGIYDAGSGKMRMERDDA